MNIKGQPFVKSLNTFALDLYANLSGTEGNLCISPFSISTALAMTFAGARGITEKQMARVMQVSTSQPKFHKDFSKLLEQICVSGQSDGIELLLANSIYPQKGYPFLKAFVDCLQENYQTVLTPLNYQEPETAREIINQWVKEKTREYIPELIPSGMIDPLTRLVLINAMYFKGLWESPFDKDATIKSSFWVTKDAAIDVPTMRQREDFNYAEDNLVQVLELPYQGKNFSLVIILPREALPIVEKSLTNSNYSKWLARLSNETVDIHLPVFKIEGKVLLNDILISMGMTDAFDGDKANFSGMDGMKYPDGLYISDVVHQANIEVNEEGTTAAAATAAMMRLRGLPKVFQFHANHPFIFLLRENTTGSILFIGRVLNPLS